MSNSAMGGVTLLQRRRMMTDKNEVPGSRISDYVQSDLMLLMDGKEKGGTNEWVSHVNGYSYARSGATFYSDHVYFDGVNDYLSCSTPSSSWPASNAGTIEFVIDYENLGINSGAIFYPRTAAKLCAHVRTDGLFVIAADTTTSRARTTWKCTEQKASFSLTNTNGYQNGEAMDADNSHILNDLGSVNYIGRSKSGNYFKGKIYSIRIYTRKLTQAEIMQNLSVDNLRFNLGLTLQ